MTAYAVRCDEHTTKPCKTRDAAEHQLERIEKDGHCELDHEIVEVLDAR